MKVQHPLLFHKNQICITQNSTSWTGALFSKQLLQPQAAILTQGCGALVCSLFLFLYARIFFFLFLNSVVNPNFTQLSLKLCSICSRTPRKKRNNLEKAVLYVNYKKKPVTCKLCQHVLNCIQPKNKTLHRFDV